VEGRPSVVHMTSAHPAHDTRILEKECRTLAQEGYNVWLLAPHERDEVVDGVRIVAVSPVRNRAERMTVGAWRVYRRARQLRADVYHLHDPELLPWGLLLQATGHASVVYDAHEYVGMDVGEKEWLPRALSGPLGWIADRVEKLIARRLAGVVTVNPHMADLFRQVNRMVTVVANYPPRPEAVMPPTDRDPDGIIYVGGMGGIRGYALVLNAMPQVRARRPSATCRILGALDRAGLPAGTADLSAETLRARGIEFLRTVPFNEVPARIAAHAVGWLPWRLCNANLYGTPTKLLEYMAGGLPVVVSDLPMVSRIVTEANCGVVVPWDSPRAHAEALLHLLEHPDEAARLGANGRRVVMERMNWDGQREALLTFYEELLAAVPQAARS
jgi:glycosyltransferase involved in cell wall biosynthesis